ncbi:MAG TPA: autotransporter domain-containing protein [Stellaceae bacterium]|jgi:autotransporter-associated beta strand protein|nr:autotransporter domain-containing protein [Stellaceae bacterium]
MFVSITAVPSFGQTSGGAGGAVGSPGGSGGVSSAGGVGADGGLGVFDSGGGGGGAGAGPPNVVGLGLFGGNGGLADGGAPGGTGAFFAGGDGFDGGSVGFANLGAGGGGGGAAGTLVTTSGTSALSGNSVGGNGGNGGFALGVAGGGGGGAGGFGISIAASSAILNNNQIITGGRGGDGGGGSFGGNGGDGGVGVYFVGGGTLNNSGSIAGGAGGAGGVALTPGVAGANGVGVEGSNLTITDSGLIAGASGNGVQANAITFTRGANTLTLQPGSTLIGNIEIDGGGSVSFNQASAQVLNNAITGNGSVVQAGTGELTLTGVNTYTGGTTVSAGTLQGDTSSLQGNIADNAALVFNQGANGVFGGSISGAGTLTKIGGGTLLLDGANSFTGSTTVSAGALEIGDAAHPGASIGGNVSVSNAALVTGHGSIGGNLSNTAGGTVMPGGSIGTLTAGGNYAQGATSTLAIEVSPGAASQLHVGGSASLAGTLALTFDPGVYAGKTFALVSAGSVTGTFGTVTDNAPGLDQSLVYTPTEVDLTPSGGFQVAPTEDSVFGALGGAALLGAQQANATVLGHLADQHDGTGTDTIKTSLAGKAPTQLAFNGGTQALASVVSALPDAMTQMGGWFRALGTFADLDGSASAPGFNSRAGGFMAGFDGPVADHLRLGIAGGYGHTDLSASDGESGTIDTPRLALYGSYDVAGWAVDALAGYGYDMIHAQRPIAAMGAIASSHHNGQEANAALQASRPFAFGDLVVQPAAGVTYTHLFEKGFAETGAGGFDLTNPSRDTDSLRPFVSASAAETFATASGMRIVPEADIAYSYETMSTPPSLVQVGGGSFTVEGVRPSRNQLQIGGGITMAMTNQFALHAAYHAVLPTGNLFEQIVEVGAICKF